MESGWQSIVMQGRQRGMSDPTAIVNQFFSPIDRLKIQRLQIDMLCIWYVCRSGHVSHSQHIICVCTYLSIDRFYGIIHCWSCISFLFRFCSPGSRACLPDAIVYMSLFVWPSFTHRSTSTALQPWRTNARTRWDQDANILCRLCIQPSKIFAWVCLTSWQANKYNVSLIRWNA